MKRKRLTVMWAPSASSRSRIFCFPTVLPCIFVALLFVSWAILGTGGYLAKRLYRDYLQLRQENSRLLQKEKEMEALRHTVESIRKNEITIRNFLGLDNSEGNEDGLGQGGEPSSDLSSIDPSDAMLSSSLPSPAKFLAVSSLTKARKLEADMQKLLRTMRDRRTLWDSTPSVIPVDTEEHWFTSGFGWRRSPFTGLKEFHNGLDISSRKGTPIIAPADGVVIKSGKDKYLGKYLKIDHGRKILTIYGHLSKIKANVGQKVNRGDVIGLMGSTGLSTGNHLHYIVKVKKKYVNPLHYILNANDNILLANSFD